MSKTSGTNNDVILEVKGLKKYFPVHRGFLQQYRLDGLGDHQQQDDGTEATADDVEERNAELLNFAPVAHQGQSREGDMKLPPVVRATFQ